MTLISSASLELIPGEGFSPSTILILQDSGRRGTPGTLCVCRDAQGAPAGDQLRVKEQIKE